MDEDGVREPRRDPGQHAPHRSGKRRFHKPLPAGQPRGQDGQPEQRHLGEAGAAQRLKHVFTMLVAKVGRLAGPLQATLLEHVGNAFGIEDIDPQAALRLERAGNRLQRRPAVRNGLKDPEAEHPVDRRILYRQAVHIGGEPVDRGVVGAFACFHQRWQRIVDADHAQAFGGQHPGIGSGAATDVEPQRALRRPRPLAHEIAHPGFKARWAPAGYSRVVVAQAGKFLEAAAPALFEIGRKLVLHVATQ